MVKALEIAARSATAWIEGLEERPVQAFFSGTTWQGRCAMRVSVVNWRTNDDDIRRAIAATEVVLKGGR